MYYSKKEIEHMEDRYENEFSLSILTDRIPERICEIENPNWKEFFYNFMSQNYSLLIQIPNMFPKKILMKEKIIENNEYFSLLNVSKESFNDKVLDFLVENEYINGFNFFLIKRITNVDFSLPLSTMNRLEIKSLKDNDIYITRIDLNEIIKLEWK
ncbi:hypothetical protein [Peribacillus muralis]|uniref:hypothetical protein n=1 Tax=Peribacillus muralis TaxID=264697 RepID=UPI000711060E|nr:hypothetical protein [Peribacillus muralis]